METIGVEGFIGRLAVGHCGDRGVTVDRDGWRKTRHRRGSESWRSACTYSRNLNHEQIERNEKSEICWYMADFYSPEDGVSEAMGVAMMLLGLRAANCCICSPTVPKGDRYAD